ncbi:hypothetical protein BU25DRAFT_103507 [Macroventuria anomochaeta]|uniref:Uncharacterized protein n=1 Tax=Macroventuria anomochaeta TaxID=301207 RepID=A0ACB6RXN9_9PLEO|nr:uncharacterized protein BU25DRAFT_103507 [Macroventuria anomochaeta]KAF2626185.1 hypothetical protein BU25DRAFT_103507 [Macroventuria anomochaeta]
MTRYFNTPLRRGYTTLCLSPLALLHSHRCPRMHSNNPSRRKRRARRLQYRLHRSPNSFNACTPCHKANTTSTFTLRNTAMT